MGIATYKTHSNVNAICDYFRWVEMLLILHCEVKCCGMFYHIAPVAFVHIMMIIIVNQQSFMLIEGCDWAL